MPILALVNSARPIYRGDFLSGQQETYIFGWRMSSIDVIDVVLLVCTSICRSQCRWRYTFGPIIHLLNCAAAMDIVIWVLDNPYGNFYSSFLRTLRADISPREF